MSIYDYKVTLENGDSYSLDKYKGHPMIIVNTATKCGFAPQFEQLEAIYKKYQDQGLIILGFPSDQFHQELADGQAAAAACRTQWGVTFPMHQMIKVNGSDADPLFKYLKGEAFGMLGGAIKWNFTKFLVDGEGNVVERVAPKTNPDKMIPAIEKVLAQ
ncbi:glutathione peroxidase [Lacticaseibacillus pabuli]|uniref:Glutathione peroxidase n=1 Tax=Lacticaseibacillus pabuli TaxID=3025672 RepID=A0ABY7WRK6_9LACO|nr:glutathione peroxidase [Lacticaseibacillus sp. KACC 23028]WDF82817.1 glutathione peroxidase [Lacticaseibacillus sp. KACC 23028]